MTITVNGANQAEGKMTSMAGSAQSRQATVANVKVTPASQSVRVRSHAVFNVTVIGTQPTSYPKRAINHSWFCQDACG